MMCRCTLACERGLLLTETRETTALHHSGGLVLKARAKLREEVSWTIPIVRDCRLGGAHPVQTLSGAIGGDGKCCFSSGD